MHAAKDELRQKMRTLREALDPDEVQRRSAQAAPHVLGLAEVQAARRVALYAPVRNELDPRPVHDALAARGAVVLYPRVLAGGALAFAAVDDVTALVPGRFGIPEPPADNDVSAGEIDLFLVPGLAFGPQGERLGWGRGHYDRALAAAPSALRVGYGYDFQLVPVVPVGADDEHVDVVVTCAGARRTARSERRIR